MRFPPLIAVSLALPFLSSGCSSPATAHFFPRLQPLFAGLDETRVPDKAKPALAEAKADFRSARRHQEPPHARLVNTDPKASSKVYQGTGYRLTVLHESAFYAHADGLKIAIDPSITGGQPYHYEEVDEVTD